MLFRLRPESKSGMASERVCRIALHRKGWIVDVGILRVSAFKPERQVKLYARDFRTLLNLCGAADLDWAKKHPR